MFVKRSEGKILSVVETEKLSEESKKVAAEMSEKMESTHDKVDVEKK